MAYETLKYKKNLEIERITHRMSEMESRLLNSQIDDNKIIFLLNNASSIKNLKEAFLYIDQLKECIEKLFREKKNLIRTKEGLEVDLEREQDDNAALEKEKEKWINKYFKA